jgi:hypothetical protein
MEEPANASTLDPSLQPLLLTPQEYDMMWGNSTNTYTRRKPNGLLVTFMFIAFVVVIMISGYCLVGYLGSRARRGF